MRATYPVEALADDLRALGLRWGDTVLVHASLRHIGPTERGAATVLDALRAAIGARGTIVVPTFTTSNSLTSPEYRARVRGLSEREVAAYQETMPGFDPATTPSTGMGLLAEHVRTAPGARRSTHPQTSLAALGPLAETLTRDHHDDCHLGEDSPLGHLYRLGAQVLLLGVGFEACTALHLAEYRLPDPPRQIYDCVVADHSPAGGESARRWFRYEDVRLDDSDFGLLGSWLERQRSAKGGNLVQRTRVGDGIARLLPMALAVDMAVEWFEEHRRARGGSAGDQLSISRPPG